MDNLFKWWVGKWSIVRKSGDEMQGAGDATFHKVDNNTLIYDEKLMVTFQGNSISYEASRSYKFVKEDNKISKYFVEPSGNRFFYELNFLDNIGKIACGKHLCVNDTYTARYDFDYDIDTFTLTYKVSGPEKNYDIETRFSRIIGVSNDEDMACVQPY